MNAKNTACLLLPLLASLFASLFASFAAAGAPRDDATLILDRYVAAYNKANPEALAALFAAEAEFYSLQNRRALVTPQQIRKYYEPLTKLKYQIRFDQIAMTAPADNVVVASVSESYVARRKNTDFQIDTRTTFTMVKLGAEWKIVSYHKSLQPEK